MAALADRYSPKKLAPLTTTTRTRRKPINERPLFAPEEDELPPTVLADGDEAEDPELAAAIQESLETEEEASLRRAMEASRAEAAAPRVSENGASSSKVTLDGEHHARASRLPAYLADEDDEDDEDGI